MTADTNKPDRAADEQSLGNLLRLAGERPEIPLSIESRVYHAVQQEWRASTTEPNADKVYAEVHKSWRRGARQGWVLRWLVPVGVAASAILVFALLSKPESTPPMAVATVASTITSSGNVYQQGDTVYAGETLETATNSGVSLLLERNATLRIDENTRIRVDGVDRFTLLEGRVYADSGQFIYRDGGLTIDTPFGLVRDLGTQFAIAVGAGSLEIAVREGRIVLSDDATSVTAKMGERLTKSQGQSATVGELDTHDSYWDWITELTPAYDTSNKSLLDFLKWAARETGRELRFENDESRMFAMRTDVHGSIVGLTPDEALEAILSTTTLEFRIERDKILLLHRNDR